LRDELDRLESKIDQQSRQRCSPDEVKRNPGSKSPDLRCASAGLRKFLTGWISD
jgi:hypothetical protein